MASGRGTESMSSDAWRDVSPEGGLAWTMEIVSEKLGGINAGSAGPHEYSPQDVTFLNKLKPADLAGPLLRNTLFRIADEARNDKAELEKLCVVADAFKFALDNACQEASAKSEIERLRGERFREGNTLSDKCRPSNNAITNRARIKPGQTIRVRKVERMKATTISPMDRAFVSSPGGAIHDSYYTCLPRFFVDDQVSVLVLTSKSKRGFGSLRPGIDGDSDRYVQIAPEGSDYQMHRNSSTVLFMRGMKEYPGSMLCLGEYLVPLTEWIMLDCMSLTEESLVRLNQITLENKYVENHMTGFLETAGITAELAGRYQALGCPGPGERVVWTGDKLEMVCTGKRVEITRTAGRLKGLLGSGGVQKYRGNGVRKVQQEKRDEKAKRSQREMQVEILARTHTLQMGQTAHGSQTITDMGWSNNAAFSYVAETFSSYGTHAGITSSVDQDEIEASSQSKLRRTARGR